MIRTTNRIPRYFPVTGVLIGISGGLVMLAMAATVLGENLQHTLVLSLFATAGALISGAMAAPLFGRYRWTGWLLAGLGALIATSLGAGIGGLLYFAFGELLFGVGEAVDVGLLEAAALSVALVLAAVFSTLVGLFWLAIMTLIHLVTRHLRNPA